MPDTVERPILDVSCVHLYCVVCRNSYSALPKAKTRLWCHGGFTAHYSSELYSCMPAWLGHGLQAACLLLYLVSTRHTVYSVVLQLNALFLRLRRRAGNPRGEAPFAFGRVRVRVVTVPYTALLRIGALVRTDVRELTALARKGFSLRAGHRGPSSTPDPRHRPTRHTTLYRTAHCSIPAHKEAKGGRGGGGRRAIRTHGMAAQGGRMAVSGTHLPSAPY